MPPKAKKDSNKKKKTTSISLDDVDTTILNRNKLEEFCVCVNNELNNEKLNSEYLRLDRDKLLNMIAISIEHLKMLRSKKRQYESDIRDAEEEHRTTMTFSRQKLKHLKNELESKCFDKKLNTKKIMGGERENHKEVAIQIIGDINDIKRKIIEMENEFHDNKVKIYKEHAGNISKIQDTDQNIHSLSETKREKFLKEKEIALESIFAAAYDTLVSLKNKDYQRVLTINTTKSIQLKHYYGRIINHNNELIQLLKNKMQETRDSMSKLDKQFLTLKKEEMKLTEELSRLGREKYILQEKLSFSEEHKQKLKRTKEKLLKNTKRLQDLNVQNEILSMINEKQDTLQKEEDKITSSKLFKSGAKAQRILLVIEVYVIHMYHSLNEIDTQLREIKGIYEKNGKWNKHFESVYEYFDTSLDLINYEIAEIADERRGIFRTYRAILKKLNIPFENTGFVPLPFEYILKNVTNTRMLVSDNYMHADSYLTDFCLEDSGERL